MLPFEFIVPGIPVSQQTRNRARLRTWMATIKSRAAQAWPNGSGPTREAVKITVVYYYDRIPLDADNFIKPVQDALAGVVYIDDGQVSDVTIRRTNLSGSFRVRGMSSILAEGFTTGQEFLYIRIEAAPDHVELL